MGKVIVSVKNITPNPPIKLNKYRGLRVIEYGPSVTSKVFLKPEI